MKANNYPVTLYSPGEVAIQTNPKQLEATNGVVYLTQLELKEMLKMVEPKSFKVVFTYDEQSRKWDVTVIGASTDLEARQGFNAVVLTCQELNPDLLNHGLVKPADVGHSITPAV